MSTKPIREWWNRVVPLRVKYLVITSACILLLTIGFEYQTSSLAADRAADLRTSLVAQCFARVDSRNDLRNILFKIVDLTDLFDPTTVTPESKAFTDNYTNNRISYINANYPMLSGDQCKSDGSIGGS